MHRHGPELRPPVHLSQATTYVSGGGGSIYYDGAGHTQSCSRRGAIYSSGGACWAVRENRRGGARWWLSESDHTNKSHQ